MAADQERAQRIAELRRERHVKWKVLAEYVGVEQRSAQLWAQTGEISFDNAKKLAELFEVDAFWLMNGVESRTPSPFAGPDATASQLDRIEAKLDALLRRLPATESDADADLDHLDIPEDEEPGAQVA